MIFYFSGTGNSLFAAKRLLAEGEALVNVADAIQTEAYEYTVKDGEKVGFVFPVYFYTVPTIVEDFIANLKLQGAEYVYAVITCGGGISQAGAVLNKLLMKRGIRLDYVTSLLMPDNSMLFYQIPPAEMGKERLLAAKKRLEEIRDRIDTHETVSVGKVTFASDLIGVGYKLCNKTGKFYADEKCVGCGMCAKICPQKVIVLENGKPQWTKATCSKCSACINRCPKSAIQYGKSTKNRNRYVNPEL